MNDADHKPGVSQLFCALRGHPTVKPSHKVPVSCPCGAVAKKLCDDSGCECWGTDVITIRQTVRREPA